MSDEQPSTTTHAYRIAQLISDTLAEKGLTRKDVAHRLGYKRLDKAYTVLDACLRSGRNGGEVFRARLARALDIPQSLIDTACAETDAVFAAAAKALEDARDLDFRRRARQAFRPHLWIEPESARPAQLFGFQCCPELQCRYVDVPAETVLLPLEEQKAIVRKCIAARQLVMRGTAGVLGRIMGYQYAFSFDDYWRVTPDGTFLELAHEPPTDKHMSIILAAKAAALTSKRSGGQDVTNRVKP